MDIINIYKTRPVLIFWILFAIFMLYGTLIPFDISLAPENIETNISQVNLTPFFYNGRLASRMDMVSNLLLFIVYGILFHSAFTRPGRNQLGLFCICAASGFFFSALIEIYQFLSISRISSITDVIIDTAGGAIGCAASWIYHRFYKKGVLSWTNAILKSRPLLLLLIIYSALIFLNFLLPLDISIQISDIKHSIKNINLIPFANFHDYQNYFVGVAGELSLYMIFGFLASLCFLLYTNASRISSALLTILLVFAFSVTVELSQVFIIARVTDVTDIITALLGSALGIAGSWFLKRKQLLITLYIGFLLYYGLMPFKFLFSLEAVRHTTSLKSLIPFYIYWEHTTIFTFNDFIEGIVLFLPLGFLFALNVSVRRRLIRRFFLYGMIVGGLIEFCQLFILTRHFDITDIFLAGIGAALGGWCHIRFLMEKHTAA